MSEILPRSPASTVVASVGEQNLVHRVFTNRNLRMETIAAIGFDMDHTLALYRAAVFEQLCFDLAVENLVATKGYPERIRRVEYDRQAVTRGLIVDKRRGNLLKLDAYGYVARVRHGTRRLDRQQRRHDYKRGRIRLSPARYRIVDTLFDLPEGSLYTALIDLHDEQPGLLPDSYRQLFDDVRDAIDTIHRDGSLKRRIMADLGRYFVPDPRLEETLVRFREAGKKLFLLTNSEPDYTGAVMDHLLSDGRGHWTELFDLIVCTAGKPDYFLPRGRARAIPRGRYPQLSNRRGNGYTGGDAFFLESKLGVLGDRILYFGDHTYGDILKSKKSVGWRTAMIVPELEEELLAMAPLRELIRELEHLEDSLEDLTAERDRLTGLPQPDGEAVKVLQEYIHASLARRSYLHRRIQGVTNPWWGSLFREGRAPSRFGAQIRDVACIYTSRVSNFAGYPSDKFFVCARERLPHETVLLEHP